MVRWLDNVRLGDGGMWGCGVVALGGGMICGCEIVGLGPRGVGRRNGTLREMESGRENRIDG